MKKLLLTIVATLVLVGCGSAKGANTQTLVCEMSEGGFESTTEFVFKNDKFDNASLKSTVSYEDMGITADEISDEDKEQASSFINMMFSSLGEVKLDYTDKGMDLDVLISAKALENLPGVEGKEINKITFNEMKISLEEAGTVCTAK